MEEYMYIAAIVGFIFGVLQIILFFKLWIMTNDIRKIKNKYLGEVGNYTQPKITEQNTAASNRPIRIISVLFTLASLMGAYYMPMWIGIMVVLIDVVLLVYAFTRK